MTSTRVIVGGLKVNSERWIFLNVINTTTATTAFLTKKISLVLVFVAARVRVIFLQRFTCFRSIANICIFCFVKNKLLCNFRNVDVTLIFFLFFCFLQNLPFLVRTSHPGNLPPTKLHKRNDLVVEGQWDIILPKTGYLLLSLSSWSACHIHSEEIAKVNFQ